MSNIFRKQGVNTGGGGGGGSASIKKAIYEESTALYNHAVNDLIVMESNNVKTLYKVTNTITAGDTIIDEGQDANITSNTGIGADTQVYISGIPSSYESLVPVMTSDTTPSGEVSASSVLNEYGYTYPAYEAFDGIIPDSGAGSKWLAERDASNQWLMYDFKSHVKVTRAILYPYMHSGQVARIDDYKYQASNDGLTWVDLTETLYATNTRYEDYFCSVPMEDIFTKNVDFYRYYRIFIPTLVVYQIGIAELQFYSQTGPNSNGIFLLNADGTLKEYGNNSGSGGGDTSSLANKTDLTAIILTGTTNTSGGTITAGTWFYLNGKPCIAKVDIASNATFTLNTNYEEKTVGSALSELNNKEDIIGLQPTSSGKTIHVEKDWDILLCTVWIGSTITATYIHIVDNSLMTQLLAGDMQVVTITPISKNNFTISLPNNYAVMIKSLFGKKVTVQS